MTETAQDWKCAGCGTLSPDRQRSCDCHTNVVCKSTGEHAWKRDPGNPCAKIFEHKWLDPECVEIGCQSRVLLGQRNEAISELTGALEDYAETIASLRAEMAVKDERNSRLQSELVDANNRARAWQGDCIDLRSAARRDSETIARLRICAAGLTPVSEDEKRGMERVLAILDRKIAEGGIVSSDAAAVERHDAHYRARWSAFSECAEMLRIALAHLPQEPMTERQWQPIETAPKDGTRILVSFQNYENKTRQAIVRWEGEWIVGMDRQANILMRLKRRPPTHWMPLPEPPK